MALEKDNPDKKIQVFNLGVCAITSEEIVRHFYRNMATYKPNLAIILMGNNNNYPRLAEEFEETYFFQMLSRLKICRLILFSYQLLNGLLTKRLVLLRSYSDIYISYTVRNYPPVRERIASNLNYILTIAAKNNCKVIICNYFFSPSNGYLRDFAIKEKVPFCDNEKLYSSSSHPDWISEDGWHPSFEGYSAIAGNIYDTIKKYNLVDFVSDK